MNSKFRAASLASIALAAFAAAGAVAQEQPVDSARSLNLPANPTVFGASMPSVVKATAIVNGEVITQTDVDQRLALLAIANGGRAQASVQSIQIHAGDRYDTPLHASATLAGDALSGASGIASINQASGSGNTELNVVAATLADQGIRETNDDTLASFASAGGQGEVKKDLPGGTRSVGVESTALRGFGGVLQLNQIAGSGNATGNQLGLSVQGGP